MVYIPHVLGIYANNTNIIVSALLTLFAKAGEMGGNGMSEIVRKDVNEEWAHSGIIKAGDYCYLNYCAGNVGGTIEDTYYTCSFFSDFVICLFFH